MRLPLSLLWSLSRKSYADEDHFSIEDENTTPPGCLTRPPLSPLPPHLCSGLLDIARLLKSKPHALRLHDLVSHPSVAPQRDAVGMPPQSTAPPSSRGPGSASRGATADASSALTGSMPSPLGEVPSALDGMSDVASDGEE
jgi:hypothetical protein